MEYSSLKNSEKLNFSKLHSAELSDGYDWGRLNLQSVTEQNHLDDFLATAELAGTEFVAEKLNITFVNPNSKIGILSPEEKAKISEAQKENLHLLKIPRRPKWDRSMDAEELQNLERQAFLEWRKTLSELQEIDGIVLTPYEKNLEFWRQLWRVIEKSDVIVQILDARNPLLFRCEDLENYIKDVSQHKNSMLLLNKSDFLTEKQRRIWAQYFSDAGILVVFYSAANEKKTRKISEESGVVSDDTDEEKDLSEKLETLELRTQTMPESNYLVTSSKTGVVNDCRVLTKEELVKKFKDVYTGPKEKKETVIGLVGYPNVGKSSTINSLISTKKVSVSSTPGKTKHFQTIFIDDELMLCDCPGLVMPTFVSTKAEMVIWGILPIDQMRDHVGPTNQVVCHIPKHIFEDTYGIFLPKPQESEDPNRKPTAEELLDSYGFMRGFMNARGLPDHPRAARYILKDFVNGKLLYCHAPPGSDQESFHIYPEKRRQAQYNLTRQMMRITKTSKTTPDLLDRTFFDQNIGRAHSKGRAVYPGENHTRGVIDGTASNSNLNMLDKPWKKHNKKNKREKLRRVYAHLDE
ncbi:hypothetical protein QYM36_007016 [Artemia franciscana]|uniref:Large subunit GTPase 1 homolog n=1 Tax=Artemia franciscana TaxID=6661 RepID=A0AA88L8V6_ARTSF|nr:hypothetical protein QYM36_007016 [Artemia franciscana]